VGWRFRPLSKVKSIQTDCFECADEEINKYFRESAVLAEEEGFSRIFLMLSEEDESRVVGFYTLSDSSIPAQELPSEFMKGFLFPCPAKLIGQFAIDKSFSRQGLSRKLLWDVYRRILFGRRISGFRAIRVDTRTDTAKNFWIKQGFVPFKKHKSSLFLPVQTLVREIEEEIYSPVGQLIIKELNAAVEREDFPDFQSAVTQFIQLCHFSPDSGDEEIVRNILDGRASADQDVIGWIAIALEAISGNPRYDYYYLSSIENPTR
jgi:GNAT superfamily N-acetyltransferase